MFWYHFLPHVDFGFNLFLQYFLSCKVRLVSQSLFSLFVCRCLTLYTFEINFFNALNFWFRWRLHLHGFKVIFYFPFDLSFLQCFFFLGIYNWIYTYICKFSQMPIDFYFISLCLEKNYGYHFYFLSLLRWFFLHHMICFGGCFIFFFKNMYFTTLE